MKCVKRVRKRIEDLKIERDSRLELISLNRKDMQSQISRIKQTIEKVLDSDTSLADKIRTIFREQGITIASILTAFGLLISTIVGFVTGGGGGAQLVPQPPKKPDKNWIQKQLSNIARLLGKLAQKFGEALPGIIGSIISMVIKSS